MKTLFYILFLIASVASLSAVEWEKIDLPSYPYYEVKHNSNLSELEIHGVDSLPKPKAKYQVDYDFESTICQSFFDLGIDTVDFKSNHSIANPFFNVLFVSIPSQDKCLYSKDGGRIWAVTGSEIENLSFGALFESVVVGNSFFVCPHTPDVILQTKDSCKTWTIFADDISDQKLDPSYNQLQAVNDSTLFYIQQSAYFLDSTVYHNTITNKKESSVIPSYMMKWSYDPTVVRGDTIDYFLWYLPSYIYRSIDRGNTWGIWFDMTDVFHKLAPAAANQGIEYTFDGDVITAVMDRKGSDGKFENRYCVSPDYGKTWYFTDKEKPIVINGACYFPKGTYIQYDTLLDLRSNAYFLGTDYGTYRESGNKAYYQTRVTNNNDIKNLNQVTWDKYNFTEEQIYLTKHDKEYFLDEGILHLRKQPESIELASSISSFEVILETPWLDILLCQNSEENSHRLLYIKDSEVVEEMLVTENQEIFAGINTENPDQIYYIYIEKSDNIKLISEDINKAGKDTIELNLDINDDKIIKSILSGDNLYLIGKEKLYISDNKGSSFISITNPQTYKAKDVLCDNVAVYQGDIYTSGSKGILKLNDKLEWENVLDSVTTAYAFAVEFLNNKIYAYTEEGLFVSLATNKVSTEDGNRNTIIETSGGIYFGYSNVFCFYADRLQQEYAGRFSYVVYHGNYESSTPKNDTDPDFRTEGADSVLAYIRDLNELNRNYYIDITDGDEVTDPMDKIHAQTSEVNISVSADVNPNTRELTANVSYLYKKEGSGSHTLSVFLLQDYIKGKQELYTNVLLPPLALDGQYYHRNVFRMSLSDDAKGDKIPNTSEGIYGERNFKIILPDTIGNIKLELADLKLIAFINKEDEYKEVLQVVETEVNLPDKNLVNLNIEDITETKYEYFFNEFIPKVHITNYGSTNINQFDLNLKLTDTTYSNTYYEKINNNFAKSVIVDTVKADFVGNYSFAVTGFGNINNSHVTGEYIADNNPLDNDCLIEGIRLQRNAFVYTQFTFEEDSDKNYGIEYRNGLSVQLLKSTNGDSIGAENSHNTLQFYLGKSGEYEFKTAYVVFGEADFTSVSEAYMSYYYAYLADEAGGTLPTCTSEYSTDDGKTWIEIHSMNLKQTSSTKSPYHKLHSDEYIKEYVPIKECIGKKVILRIGITAGLDGLACWLDQISISNSAPILSASTDKMDFGKVTIADNSYSERTVQLNNIGSETLTLESFNFRGADAAAFEFVDIQKDTSLAAGESLIVTIRFTPKENSQYLANLEFETNDPENKTSIIRLEGWGEGTSIAEKETSEVSLSISPNPASEYIYYSFGGNIEQIEIIDLNGKTFQTESNGNQIDISNLSSGTYFLKIKSDGRAFLKQFVVAR